MYIYVHNTMKRRQAKLLAELEAAESASNASSSLPPPPNTKNNKKGKGAGAAAGTKVVKEEVGVDDVGSVAASSVRSGLSAASGVGGGRPKRGKGGK